MTWEVPRDQGLRSVMLCRVRRAVERALAVVLLVGASPLLAVVALLVRVKLGSPVLFRQARIGHHEVPFRNCKFRTMTDERDPATGELLPDADRLVPFGRVLRATSLDEIPELWNVARGEMAFVGPRPLPVEYLPRFRPEERARHDVLPGLTGWAVVHGRNAVGWDERLALDVWYVEHRSLRLDLRILARTVRTVLRRHGTSAEGHATSPVLPIDRDPAA